MTAVLLAPHHDDEALFAAFTVIRERPKVIVVFESHLQANRGNRCSDGVLVTDGLRQGETRRAMTELLIGPDAPLRPIEAVYREISDHLEFWRFRDDDPAPDYEDKMSSAIAALDADRIYAPAYINGGHEQHNGVALAAEHGAQCELVRYLTYRRGTPDERVESQTPAPIKPEWVGRKLRALACYRSQIHLWPHHFLADQWEFYS